MKPLISSVLTLSLIVTALFSAQKTSAVIRDGGIDPANLGKGEWIYSMKDATNRLGGHINSVTNEVSLFKYYKSIGVRYVIIKMGTGSTNYSGCYASPHQVTVNLCNIARTNGVWVFGYTRSYGSDLAGEAALVDSVFNNGADGFVFDAEAEWESNQPWIGTNGPALAWQLGTMVRSNWPTKFIAHAPFPIIYFHSSFPYKEFGYWCDAVMPQVYHLSTAGLKNSPSATMNWMDVNFRTWQNSLIGTSSVIGGQTIYWTNSIKPIVPVQDVYGEPGNAVGRCNGTTTAHPDKDVTEFIDFAAANPTAATAGGYKGVNFWRADLHGTNQFANIAAGTSGDFPGIASNIVMDDSSATKVGTWTSVKVFGATTTTPTYFGATGSDTNSFGTNYCVKGKGTGAAYMQFNPNVVVAGHYNVYQWHVLRADAATNVPFVINHVGGTTTVFANQQTNDGRWTLLGRFNFAAGTNGYIRVTDNFSNASHVAVVDGLKLVFAPLTIPSAPSGLAANAVSTSQIDLSWTDNSTNETGFIISRSTTPGGPYTDIAIASANTNSFSDTGLSPNTTYYYVVGAMNSLGISADSNEASATTQFGVSDIIIDNPAATIVGTWSTGTSASDKFGTDYRFKGQGTGANYLQYTPNIPVAGNYEIYEWHPQGGNRTIGAPHVVTYNGSAGTAFVNQQNSGGQWNLLGTYNFLAGTSGHVRITDGFADAGQVVMADAIKFVYVPGPSVPNAPSGLNAMSVSSSQINLSWSDNSSDESNFVVARSTTSGGPYADIISLAANTTSYNNTGLSANTTYYYVVRATNSAGSSANSSQASATTLPNPPAAPSGLSATTISAGQINLSWTDNSSNESNFVVGRSTTSGGPYTDIISLAANTTSYNNTGLSANTTYYYVVRATNSGGSSANSPQASATTLPFPPSAPGGLTATAVSSSQINLAWTDNSPNETSFTVARSTSSGGPYSDIATLAANTTSYNNTNLSGSTTYYYVVRASNTGGDSPNSNQASDTTFSPTPNAPSGLVATAIRATRIDLAWTDNSSNESNFIVARSTTPGGPYTDIATLAANTTSYNNNSGLSANTTYYYVVRATNASGASANSNEGSATTYETDLLIDNKSAVVVGTWSTGTSAVDKYGADYRFVGQGSGVAYLQYTPFISTAGNYDVFEWHAQGSNRTTNAPHVITYNGGSQTVYANQKTNGGQWNYLGTFNFASGMSGNIKITDAFSDAGQVVMADAIKLVPVTTTTVTFTSVAAQDGWVLELGETTGVGGSINATAATTSALRAGDDSSDRQYKTIVSFNTSALPDNATIVSATLKLRRGSVTGTNPFTTHGTCYADIKSGTGFNGALALATGDFQAAADATQVATMSNAAANGDWSTGSVNSAGRGFINKTGTTQFRVYFSLDDNDDLGNDYIGWYSGDNGTADNRPILEVVYQ